MRVLIIIFLVASFARPALKTTAIGTASAAKTSAVIILDNSYSMSYVSDDGSNFNKAKEAISDLRDEFKRGDEIYLLLTSSLGKKANNFTTDLNELQKDLSNSEIGTIPSSISASIEKGIEILGVTNNFNKEIYLFSDLQKNSFSKSKLNETLSAEGINFYIVNYSLKEYSIILPPQNFNLKIKFLKLVKQ